MFQLFYVSDAVGKLDRGALRQILVKAREKNARLDVTGMLLFRNGFFAQALEGTEQTVRSLYASISADDRHRRVTTIHTGTVTARDFPEWSMAYRDTSLEKSDVVGFSGFMNHAAEQTERASKGFPPITRHLLQTFRNALDTCPDDL